MECTHTWITLGHCKLREEMWKETIALGCPYILIGNARCFARCVAHATWYSSGVIPFTNKLCSWCNWFCLVQKHCYGAGVLYATSLTHSKAAMRSIRMPGTILNGKAFIAKSLQTMQLLVTVTYEQIYALWKKCLCSSTASTSNYKTSCVSRTLCNMRSILVSHSAAFMVLILRSDFAFVSSLWPSLVRKIKVWFFYGGSTS